MSILAIIQKGKSKILSVWQEINGQEIWKRIEEWRWRIVAFSLVIIFAFWGLNSSLEKEPSIDWSSPQEDAVISLSDPQVYSREALINDRRVEIEFLKEQLDNSKNIHFLPQIQQTLNSAQTLKLTASAASNQGTSSDSRQAASPQGEKESISSQNRQAQKNETSPLAEQGPKQPADQSKAKDAPDDHNSPLEQFRELQAFRAEIRSALSSTNLDDLHDYNGNALYRLQFQATVFPGNKSSKYGVAYLTINPPVLLPEDTRQLYLAWLRHLTSKLNQTTQTNYLALGQATRLFDVLEIACYSIPKLSGSLLPNKAELPNRIFLWDSKDDTESKSCMRLALPSESVEKLKSVLKKEKVSAAQSLTLQPSPTHNTSAVSQESHNPENLESDFPHSATAWLSTWWVRIAASIRSGREPVSNKPEEDQCENAEKADKEYYIAARETYAIWPYLAASLDALVDDNPLLEHKDIKKLRDIDHALQEYISSLQSRHSACNPLEKFKRARLDQSAQRVPQDFKDTLLKLRKVQRAYAYATTPQEHAQNISTAVSASQNLHMALALSAPPGEGLKQFPELSSKTRKTMESIERFPLVVGFSDRQEKKDGKCLEDDQADNIETFGNDGGARNGRSAPSSERSCSPIFGWVFGPKYQSKWGLFTPATLEHSLSSFQVSSDVSIPGWWPRLRMDLHTVWIADWKHGVSVLKEGSKSREIVIPMPLLTPPDLDSLTEALARSQMGPWGQRTPSTPYLEITPNHISACARGVTFVVKASLPSQQIQLWRDPEVYWEGKRARSITVLPGMKGIAAKFEESEMPDLFGFDPPPKAFDPMRISENNVRHTTIMETSGDNVRHTTIQVLARNMTTHPQTVNIHGKKVRKEKSTEITCSDDSLPDFSPKAGPVIESASPYVLSACSDGNVSFFISGTHFVPSEYSPFKGEVLLGGNIGKATLLEKEQPLPPKDFGGELSVPSQVPGTVLKATFSNLKLGPAVNLPLAVATAEGLDSVQISVEQCGQSQTKH